MLPREFWKLWSASSAANIGDGIALAAIPLLAATLSRNPFIVSLVVAAQQAPWLFVGVFAGAYVDRSDVRAILRLADAGRAIAWAVLATTVITGTISLPVLVAIAFVLGLGETLFDTAAEVLVPAIVEDHKLEDANGWMIASTIAANELLGPSIGGLSFSFEEASPFVLSSLLFALGALPLLWLRTTHRGEATGSLLREIREGVAWLARHRVLRKIAGIGVLLSALDAAWFAILVLYVTDVLGASETTFGLVLAFGSIGSLLGAFLAPRLSRRIGQMPSLGVAIATTGVAQAVIGVTSSPIVTALMLGTSGASWGIWGAVSSAMRQRITPKGMVGRVTAAYRTLARGATPVGALAGGALAHATTIRMPFLVGAPLLVAVAIAVLVGPKDA